VSATAATAATLPPDARPSARQAFELRCEVRAYLYLIDEYDLHTAFDELQADAEQSGLVAEVGQDTVQAIMAEAFAAVRDDLPAAEPSPSAEDAWNAPGRHKAVQDYHKERGERISIVEPRGLPPRWDEMSIGELWEKLNDPTRHGVAKSTLAVAEFLLRANDPKRFEAWLLRHAATERAAIVAHINKRGRS
jgi:hypothetical protein